MTLFLTSKLIGRLAGGRVRAASCFNALKRKSEQNLGSSHFSALKPESAWILGLVHFSTLKRNSMALHRGEVSDHDRTSASPQ